MRIPQALDQARESFHKQAWAEAYAQLSAADREGLLCLEDIERLALAAHLVGRDDDCAAAWVRSYHECLRLHDAARAARCAFWLGLTFLLNGEIARSDGWVARGRRLLEDEGLDCVEQGYLLVPGAVQKLHQGDSANALAGFDQAKEIGDRFGERDLDTMGRLGLGQVLVQLGKTDEGMALLDEVMVAVTAGELSAIVVGIAYCAVIGTCQAIFDLRRAREWTAALSAWCAAHPDIVPYRRQCLVHRAEIMQLHGAWPDAMDEAKRACELLSQPTGQSQIGAALYQKAELHRLRGDFAEAEEGYRQANQRGRTPQPGLALLRLAQGDLDAASGAIRLAVEQTTDLNERSKLLSAQVEIMLAAHDIEAAQAGADELTEMARNVGAALLHALSRQGTGAVLLGKGEARAALTQLRRAWTVWQELEAPYEAARVRVLVGLAYRELGDEDTAEMELDAARWVFQELGAVHDLARLEGGSRKPAGKELGGLTEREVQVLRLAATGKTNHAIAAELFVSEHTVRRHLQNIFTKLGVSSRAAATAFAFQHNLL